MISFDKGSSRFDLRAAGIVVHEGRVLLHKRDGDAFWALPGGRVEIGETAERAVIREFQEEIAESIDCGGLVCVVENFFRHDESDHHEVGLYFAATLDASLRLVCSGGPFHGKEGSVALTFAWFDLTTLDVIDFRPSALVDALNGAPLGFRHIVCRDPSSPQIHSEV